jgi:hypothetical protein
MTNTTGGPFLIFSERVQSDVGRFHALSVKSKNRTLARYALRGNNVNHPQRASVGVLTDPLKIHVACASPNVERGAPTSFLRAGSSRWSVMATFLKT